MVFTRCIDIVARLQTSQKNWVPDPLDSSQYQVRLPRISFRWTGGVDSGGGGGSGTRPRGQVQISAGVNRVKIFGWA